MKSLFKIFIILLVVISISGCKSPTFISHGSSFGHCQGGHCNKELKLMEKKTTFSSWPNADPGAKAILEVTNQGAEFKQAAAKLDLAVFKKLKTTYGCPDCADGGSEWIEVRSGMDTKRVTFEFGNPPRELKALNDELLYIQLRYENNKR